MVTNSHSWNVFIYVQSHVCKELHVARIRGGRNLSLLSCKSNKGRGENKGSRSLRLANSPNDLSQNGCFSKNKGTPKSSIFGGVPYVEKTPNDHQKETNRLTRDAQLSKSIQVGSPQQLRRWPLAPRHKVRPMVVDEMSPAHLSRRCSSGDSWCYCHRMIGDYRYGWWV